MAEATLQSKAERAYVHDGIEQDLRGDGRRREDVRSMRIELGPIQTAMGSARVTLGATDILCAVKAEVGAPSEQAPQCGRLQCSVELPAGADRGATEEAATELSGALEAALLGTGEASAALPLEPLCIQRGHRCWVLHVDALVLNADGNALDAVSIAAKAALADTRLPKVTLVKGSGDEPAELELDDDPEAETRLDVSRVPVVVTVSKCGRHYFVDAAAEEEAHAEGVLSVAVTPGGAVRSAGVRGRAALPAAAAMEMVALARRAGVALQKSLTAYLVSGAALEG